MAKIWSQALFYVAPSLDMSGGGEGGSEGCSFLMADDDVHYCSSELLPFLPCFDASYCSKVSKRSVNLSK